MAQKTFKEGACVRVKPGLSESALARLAKRARVKLTALTSGIFTVANVDEKGSQISLKAGAGKTDFIASKFFELAV